MDCYNLKISLLSRLHTDSEMQVKMVVMLTTPAYPKKTQKHADIKNIHDASSYSKGTHTHTHTHTHISTFYVNCMYIFYLFMSIHCFKLQGDM